MMRRAGVLAVIGVLAACEPPSPEVEEGSFIVRLGTDTTAVERYTFTGDRLEVLAVSRSPQTRLREATLELDEVGRIVRYESRVLDPLAPEGEDVLQWTVTRYGEHDAEVETRDGDEVRTTTVEANPEMVPFSFNHFSLMELAVRRGIAEDRSEVHLLFDGPLPVALRRPAPDSVAVDTGILGTWYAQVDEEGRILAMDAGDLGREIERVPDLDVDALARRWVDADARGVGMGPLSPRDTTRATVHGAEIVVDYSRPSKRGRTVFGGLVPYGEVWRTGADLATHLTTDRPLELAGQRLPPGTYTLFTVPGQDEWTLMVNRQTGQAGTTYDPEEDLLRLPLEVTSVDPPVERFTILAEEEGDAGIFRLQWAGTEARLSFRVVEGG